MPMVLSEKIESIDEVDMKEVIVAHLTPEMAKQLIEDLIAHRRNVWPDAEAIDAEATLEDDDGYDLA